MFTYGNHGNLLCYNKLAGTRSDGGGWWILGYDTSNRLTTIADPDDASLVGSGYCGKVAGLPGSRILTTKSYNPDGTLASSQTPSEYAGGVASAYTYDPNGNELSETQHHGNVVGTTYKWYDAADRLVEVEMPQDTNDYYTHGGSRYPWLTRYVYDLSQSASGHPLNQTKLTWPGGAQQPLISYGNLAKTTEWLPGTANCCDQSQPVWLDVRGNTFDPEDRPVSSYEVAFGTATRTRTTKTGTRAY